MKNIYLFLAIMLMFSFFSCKKEHKNEKKSINPYALFYIHDSVYNFMQEFPGRFLTRTNVPKSLENDSILLEYETCFTGNGIDLYVRFSKTFDKYKLENSILDLDLDNSYSTGLASGWPDYHPSNNEFDKIFEKGNKVILTNWSPVHVREGISLSFRKNTGVSNYWNSYYPVNDPNVTNDFQYNSSFVIDSVGIIKNSDFGNITDLQYFTEDTANPNVHCLLIKAKFNLKVYNEEMTDTLVIKDGNFKAIVYN